ncbi:protein kinase domain-containing protein [Actinokineospora sp. UTMC 2448]|uniref:protein kinase domain-containing protein n=1 Tax=Actinokineospora sp. UTMC 2448 TaxID=2268449 RepID=UPI00216443D2|nr:protein kinase [Actinokineospora sp. UTMC 2448]UVS79270.1 Serine/threonine-protein kinase PknK [Actinokineospora sp. UTMC 2448]
MSDDGLHPIGHGPVATVYSGTHDGEPAAFKVFPRGFDRRTLAAFTREQAALPPNRAILAVEEVTRLPDGRHALRLPLCAESLADRVLRTGGLPVDDVVILGAAVAGALAAAHAVGVVHGGITPTNILIRPSGEPAVADFGTVLRDAFTRDPMHGVEYTYPDTLRTGVRDERSDLYGLGAVLHFALTGQSPYPSRLGEQPGQRVLRVLGEPVPAIHRPDVPVALATLIARLLAPGAAQRTLDAAAVADQLADTGPVAVPVAAEEPSETPPPPPRGPRYGLAAAAVVVLGVLAVVLAMVVQREPAVSAVPPRQPVTAATTSQAPEVRLELADPKDLGDRVELRWHTTREMQFAVRVAVEGGGPAPYRLVGTRTSYTVTVDPKLKYCFSVQGSDTVDFYVTDPKPIRGAVCSG